MNEVTFLHTHLNQLCVERRFEEAASLALYLTSLFENGDHSQFTYIYKYTDYLAEILRHWGKYRSSLAINHQMLWVCNQTLSSYSLPTASAFQKIGNIHLTTGNYSRACHAFKRSIAIKRKLLKKDHPEFAVPLNNLAEVYRRTGLLEKSLHLHKESMRIRIHSFGKEHAETGASLNNFAATYQAMGKFKKAVSAYKKSLEIRRKHLGEAHPDVAQSFNNLASVYHFMGVYDTALPLYQSALIVLTNCHQFPQALMASVLNNIGSLYQAKEKWDEAEQHYLKALSIREAIYKDKHPDVANSLNNIGGLFKKKGEYQKAESYYFKALDIRRNVFKQNHPDIGTTCNNIAGIYQARGLPDKALPFYREALAITQATLGNDHQAAGNILNNMASIHQALGDPDQALGASEEANFIQDQYIHNIFHANVAEKQKLDCFRSLSLYLDAYLSLVIRNFKKDPAALKNAFELVLNRKGLILDIHSKAGKAIRSKLTPKIRKIWDERLEALSQLSALLIGSPSDFGMNSIMYQTRKSALQGRLVELEERLIKTGIVGYKDLRPNKVTLENLSNNLNPGSLLLEFIKIRDYDFKGSWLNPESRYLVFSLNSKGDLNLIDLGSAEAMEQLTSKALTSIQRERNSKESTSKRSLAKGSFQALFKLYEKIWKPVEEKVKDVDQIFISPDGALNLLPFPALFDDKGIPLIERSAISYLSFGRELAASPEKENSTDTDLTIIANPDFGKFLDQEKDFRPLQGTKKESTDIQNILSSKYPKQTVWEEKDATKSNFIHAKASKIIHIATHGFFLKNLPENDPFENPLSRSGLVFAGANALSSNTAKASKLTALEITGLDLSQTDLAVLSACSTGFGSFQNGEGVMGLRRAFKLAGVNTLMMSLWTISDTETPTLIHSFYKNYLTLIPAEALRQAQLDTIEYLKDNYGYAAVSLWAPFIIQGANAFRK